MALTFVLQKKCRVDYDSDAEELDRMMVATGRGSNPEVGDGVGQEIVPSPLGQLESYDFLGSVRPVEALISDPSSEVEIIPPSEVPVVAVPRSEPSPRPGATKVGEIGSVVGPSEFASPSLMTAPEHDRASFGLSLFLQRGDDEVGLGRGNFLRGLKWFKALPSRHERGMLENEILQVNSNRALSSSDYEIHLQLLLLQNIVSSIDLLGHQQAALKEKERANVDLQRRVDDLSAVKRKADEKIARFRADLDRELVVQ